MIILFYTYLDLINVTHLYPDDTTDPVTNVPANLADATQGGDFATFWTILSYIKGVTLKEYVTQRYKHPLGFNLFDALTLTEKLVSIVKDIHGKGIVHRDLKPDNIMITFDNYKDLTKNVEVYIIDFGMAFIETEATTDIDWSVYDQPEDATDLGDSLGNRWYRVPQLSNQIPDKLTVKEKNDLFHFVRRSPKIDASSICALFFWMLTQINPKENRDKNNLAPHQQQTAITIINKKTHDAISSLANKF